MQDESATENVLPENVLLMGYRWIMEVTDLSDQEQDRDPNSYK